MSCFKTELGCFLLFLGERITITVLFLHQRDQQVILLQKYEQKFWYLPGNTIYLLAVGTKILH